MQQEKDQGTIYRADYRPFTHSIDTVELDFVLDPESTLVTNQMMVTPLRGAATTDLVLNAEDLFFEKLLIDGQPAASERYEVSTDKLVIRRVTQQTRITRALVTALAQKVYLNKFLEYTVRSQREKQGKA